MSDAPSIKRQPDSDQQQHWESEYDEQVDRDAPTIRNRSGIEIEPLYAPEQTDQEPEYAEKLG